MRSFSVSSYAKLIDTGCSDHNEERHQAASADRVGGQTPAVPAGQDRSNRLCSKLLTVAIYVDIITGLYSQPGPS